MTIWIIIATSLISFQCFGKPHLVLRYSMNPSAIRNRGEYYRFLSSGFLHADFTHLLFNMIALYFFGDVVDAYFTLYFGKYGVWYFVTLYLSGIVVSDLYSYFRYASSPSYHSIGASGGVSAVVFASIIFQPNAKICLYFIVCLPGVMLGSMYLIWSYFKGKDGRDHINHFAHLFGALYGALFTIFLVPGSLGRFLEQMKDFHVF